MAVPRETQRAVQVPTVSVVQLTMLTQLENRGALGNAPFHGSQPAPAMPPQALGPWMELFDPLKLPLHGPWSSTALRCAKWMRKEGQRAMSNVTVQCFQGCSVQAVCF